jgi:WD40 repeat protein
MDSNRRILGPLNIGSTETGRFSHDGMKLLVGATDGGVTLLDLGNGTVICRPQRHIAPLNGLAFSPDDRVIATAGEDGQCFISDAATGRLLTPVIRHDNEIVSVQFSPDGKWIVTSSHDRTARMWNARTGEPHGEPMLHRGEVAYAEFNHRGNMVLTACRDGTTRLWDAQTGAAVTEPMMHTSALRGASFSGDDRRIVTEDHDGLRLWEAATGEPLSILQPHPTSRGIGYNAQGLHVAFSPDGESVLQGTASRDAMIWHFPEPPLPAPAWLPELLEAMAASRITSGNVLEGVPSQRWLELREKLRTLPGEDFYARWARAFCAEAPSLTTPRK